MSARVAVAARRGIHGIEDVTSLIPGDSTVHHTRTSHGLHGTAVPDHAAATLSSGDGPLFQLETCWSLWDHTDGPNRGDWALEVDVVAREGRRLWSSWSLHAWDRFGSESAQNFEETDLVPEQAKAALRFAAGARPVVGYRQALRATEPADSILAKDGTTA